MNKKVIIGLITFLIVAIIAVAVVLLNNNSNKRTSTINTANRQGSTVTTRTEEANKNTESQTQNAVADNNTTTNNKKILIAYFSRADENYSVGTVDVGNTEIMAGFIKDYLGQRADVFKIDPVVGYPTNYKECTEYATKEKNENARPEFKNVESVDLSKYDTIFIGYPIWWGDVPMIINTFLEKYDFSDKTIIPFNTHEGSGNAGTFNYIKNKMTSSNVNTNGLAIRGSDARKESSRSTVENWLKGLEF